jgi:hypothetical protein
MSLLGLLLSGMFHVVSATTLDFEDLNPGPASFDVVPAPYNGFTFGGWFFGVDTIYTAGSGVIDLYTDYANPNDPSAYVITNTNNQIYSTTPFIFDGATFSGYSGVTFQLWLGGQVVHTSGSLPDALGVDPYLPTFLASGYAGQVDQVVVTGVQGYYSMDDFTYHATATVPEPASYPMVLSGLAVVFLVAKRRRK